MEKTLIFIGIHLSLSSAYQKATTIFVVAHFNLPLILHAFSGWLFIFRHTTIDFMHAFPEKYNCYDGIIDILAHI